MMDRLPADGPNADQIEFWNSSVGDRWTDFMDSQDRMLGPLGAAAMDAASIAAGHQIIDIGCGCGTTTLELANRTGPAGSVLGIDVSTPMLQRAQIQADTAPNLSIKLVNHDAADYDFPSQSYDRVFSRFGVMFFANPVAAFSNIRSGMKADGRISFVCWQPLDLNPWMALSIAIASRHVERPDPPGPDAPGPFAFRDPARVDAILSESGFENIDIAPKNLPLRFENDIAGTVEKLLQLGPMAQPVADAPPEARVFIQTELAGAIEEYLTDDGVRIDSASWIVSADCG